MPSRFYTIDMTEKMTGPNRLQGAVSRFTAETRLKVIKLEARNTKQILNPKSKNHKQEFKKQEIEYPKPYFEFLSFNIRISNLTNCCLRLKARVFSQSPRGTIILG